MKSPFLILTIVVTFITGVNAQTTVTTHRTQLDTNSVVKDSAGVVYPYSAWHTLYYPATIH
ncbi:MAG: hypothetical protein NVSMB24_21340 [Mucilaginibacter sp.]